MILWYTKECWVEVSRETCDNLDNLNYEDYLRYHGISSLKTNTRPVRKLLERNEWYVDGNDEDVTLRELNSHY